MGVLSIFLGLVATGAGPVVDSAQFTHLARGRSAALNSVVFLYEGRTRWVGPGNLGVTPGQFDGEFQGTFLYRADGASAVDTYFKKADPSFSVVRKKKSVLDGKTEFVRGVLDAKSSLDPARDIVSGKGLVSSMNDVAPLDFFWTWYWAEWGDLGRRNYNFQGWEEVDGRDCLRFQIDTFINEHKNDWNVQRFWVDVERNAHVVRFEKYVEGKLTMKNEISLFELKSEDGRPCWLPARGHLRWFAWEDKTYGQPVGEQIIDMIRGSARVGLDLPNSLFTVRRDSALPAAGELAKLKIASESASLRKDFEAQPAREPFRTDPTSIRGQIDKNLADADRQSRELEASSPARSWWSWTATIQSALVLIGVAMLAGVSYRNWAGR